MRRMVWAAATILFGALAFAGNAIGAGAYVQGSIKPPPVTREFRAVWIATVGNINWPSKPGLPVSEQKAELLTLLDHAAGLRLNAIVFQVRPACDALYASPYEPWSEYLTGKMGQAPAPSYDPLAFAVAEAHKRGLELHAWFNPFRARYFKAISAIAPNHISRTQPQFVKKYGQFLWLDPGDPAVHEHSLKVILDVVRRYDIDGVHMDDYFYPYPEKDSAGSVIDFPDESSWRRYVAASGKLSRAEWRRQNVNNFIQRLYAAVKKEKPCVKVGVSPFGIWRPGFPPQIRGFDAYENLYADSRKWLAEGWIDYFSPQLYWSIGAREQSFPVLHKWWTEQNPKGRHIWPGLSVHGTDGKRTALEVKNQIVSAREQAGSDGTIFWGVRGLLQNRNGISDILKGQLYAEPAVIPAFPWLEAQKPAAPSLTANETTKGWRFGWSIAAMEKPRLWVLQTRRRGTWRTEILSANNVGVTWNVNDEPDAIAVSAVDRCNNVSTPTVLVKQMPPPSS
jgi:uncharacterized lipoprotein YddW (UPF0748 family)